MHEIEPFSNWRQYYQSESDDLSPFFNRTYDLFNLDKVIYNYCIHSLWDEFGSDTLYTKILFVDYEDGFAILEMMGEWNDLLRNDIMFLKREVIDAMVNQGINKFILIGEHVLNFHYSDDCYYEEWFHDIEDGWIFGINFLPFVIDEFSSANIHHYVHFLDAESNVPWRTFHPDQLCKVIQELVYRRLE